MPHEESGSEWWGHELRITSVLSRRFWIMSACSKWDTGREGQEQGSQEDAPVSGRLGGFKQVTMMTLRFTAVTLWAP